MGKVNLKISPSLANASDPNWLGWYAFEKEFEKGETIGNLLEAAVSSHAGFRQQIFDPSTYELNGEVLLFLNDSLLELPDVTHKNLSEGDTVTLLVMDIGG